MTQYNEASLRIWTYHNKGCQKSMKQKVKTYDPNLILNDTTYKAMDTDITYAE